ncbi:retinaldehyde-binding protein 1-like [Argiope bruennichi]|uniref:retinaldehyde-binding protein 1-like n=1 Tax=Argiope bruennichi TaxID=94029 RepID=UPI002495A65B|nr:retinaldehyde-binding protein 1-like [Argiope bruennichi]XP_055944743.1 retinaldehyde-binding protein 1-like [Argiope bruennichi]
MPIPVWEEEMTPEIRKIAEKELGETPEIKEKALKELRRLINEESDFRPQTNDTFLLRFLRAKKYDVKRAFKTLQNYYIFKARYSGIMTDFTPKDVKNVIEMNNMLLMPYRHPSGAAVGYARLAHFDIEKVTKEEIFATALIGLEYLLQFEASQVCGYIIILDWNKISMRILKHWLSPTFLYRGIRLVQDCVPCRAKGFHVINEPFFFNVAINLVKSLLSEKLMKRIFFHGSNLKSLHKHIPPSILPEELGGEIGPLSSHVPNMYSNILDRENAYEKLNKYGFQEKKIQHLKKQNTRNVFL